MNVWWVLLIFICQPVLWIGIIRTWLTANHRITHERKDFRSAVYREKFEIRHLVLWSAGLGILTSIVTVVLGLMVPVEFLVIYEILTAVMLLILPGALLPVGGLILSILAVWALDYFGIDVANQFQLPLGLSLSDTASANYLVLLTIAILLTGFFVSRVGGRYPAPRIFQKRRGKLVAGYPFKELLLIPTIFLVPGDWISSHLAFWPVFQLGHQSVTFLILPLLIGFKLTIFKQIPRIALRAIGRRFLILGGLGGLLIIVNYFVTGIAWYSTAAIAVIYVLIVLRSIWYDRHQRAWYSRVDEGVRLLGIMPNTPAAKMDLTVGDVILDCNHRPVSSETELYEALLLNPTYCHLRVTTRDGQYKITETAIFKDAPHELGLVLFRD
ncbi:trypsin-like serine protease with PDZ domain [Secundilactobacillus oryzae JCM 18671]|uniref:Trypsin-like serine protease with PDZ domain n=1 Tax=Secundilactobacillus oryzae JCM 18671 TaxID=1291743 RepID=A0A081BK33_9LACO|nr:PDZ domain-containing protein [Secundilactobacillus oryzae]GAK48401.1 trypsin-like serine protease with PDZ domain [Secundilactobacillus oryzae JCM 18671]